MPTTPIHGLPYPTQTAATTGPDVPADLMALADALDPKLTPASNSAGTPAALGLAAGKVGRRHRDTNTGNIYLDIGASWVLEFNAAAGNGISVTSNTIAVKLATADEGLAFTGAGELFTRTDEVTIGRTGGSLHVRDGGITAAKIAAALKPSAGAAAAAEALRALGTAAGTAAAGNDARLSDQRTPLDSSVSTAKLLDRAVTSIKLGVAQIDNEHFSAATKDGAAGTAMLRSLGTGATQAAAGNDSRILGAVQSGENLRVVRGLVDLDGTILEGSGFTISKSSSGVYTINWTTAFLNEPTVVASQASSLAGIANIANTQTTSAQVRTWDFAGALTDRPFHFIAMGPR